MARQTVYYARTRTLAHYQDGIVTKVITGTTPRKEHGTVVISLSPTVFCELPQNLKSSELWQE